MNLYQIRKCSDGITKHDYLFGYLIEEFTDGWCQFTVRETSRTYSHRHHMHTWGYRNPTLILKMEQ